MLALHIDNLLFILLVGMAALLRLLASKAGAAKKTSQEQGQGSTPPPAPRSHQPIARAPEETDADRIRKFLEALGQPATSKPPPPVAPRTDIPPRPVAPVRPPPGMLPSPPAPSRPLTREEQRKRAVILHEGASGTSEEWLRKINYPGQIMKPPAERKIFIPKVTKLPAFEVQAEAPPTEPPQAKTPAEAYAIATQPRIEPAPGEINISLLLRSSSGLRNAIILREIFGPPRSLQPLELIGSA
jgi:hypothetical protein